MHLCRRYQRQSKIIIYFSNCSILFRFKESVAKLSWDEVGRSFGDDYSNIFALIDLLLCLPASSSENERGFSNMKLTKTCLRNRLAQWFSKGATWLTLGEFKIFGRKTISLKLKYT